MGEQDLFSEKPEHKSTPKHDEDRGSWLAENVGKPLYNGLVVDTYNSALNLGHLVGADPDSIKLTRLQEHEAKDTLGWATQNFTRGAASLVPYIGCSMIAGGALSKFANFAGMARLGETGTALLSSEFTANVGGAAMYNSLRDTLPGETKLGNVAGSTAAMALWSLGNPYLGKIKAPQLLTESTALGGVGAYATPAAQFMARAALGAAVAPGALMVGDYVGKGELPSLDKLPLYERAAANATLFNAAYPLARQASLAAVDAANVAAGRGMPIQRFVNKYGISPEQLKDGYAELNRINGGTAEKPILPRFALDTSMLESVLKSRPLVRVQPNASPFAPFNKNIIHLSDAEINAFAEDPPPAFYGPKEQKLYADLAQKSNMAETLAAEGDRRIAADERRPASSILSFNGIRKAVARGEVEFTQKNENGEWVPIKYPASKVGEDSLDMAADGVYVVPTKQGGGVLNIKESLKENVKGQTEVDFSKTPEEQGIDSSKYRFGYTEDLPRIAHEIGLKPDNPILQKLVPGRKFFAAAPGTDFLFQTDTGLTMPAATRAGQQSLMAKFEGSTWLGRNRFTNHDTANNLHNRSKGPTTGEGRNAATGENSWFTMIEGETAAQITFHPLDSAPQRLPFSNTFGQTSPRGAGSRDTYKAPEPDKLPESDRKPGSI
jgi:hypothetical protein